MEDNTLVYNLKCPTCDTHKSDLGLLKGLEESVRKNFADWPADKQCDLVVCWFEKTWKEEMALQIERSKKEAAERIQQFKKENIKAINK
jgi:hypothetical protein